MEHIYTFHRLALERHYHVTLLETGFGGRTVRFGSQHESAGRDLQIIMVRDSPVQRSRLRLHADVAASHDAFTNQLAGDELRGVDGDSEAQTLCRQNGCRINAYDLACRVHQRSAGVAGIQGRVGLDDIFDQTSRLRPQAAPQGADYAGGHGVLESVWIADG